MTEDLRFKTMEEFGFGPNVMKRTKVCAQCGQAVNAEAADCPNCGEKLPGETLFDRYKQRHACCPACDTVLPRDARFCPHCGLALAPTAGETHQQIHP